MVDELSGRTAAFVVPYEGVERVELTEPRLAVEEAGGQPVLLAPRAGSVQAMNHLDRAVHGQVAQTWGRFDVAGSREPTAPGDGVTGSALDV